MADVVLAGGAGEKLGGVGEILEKKGEAAERAGTDITDPGFAGRIGKRDCGVIISRFHEGDLASIKAMQSIRIGRPALSFIFVSEKEIPFPVLTLMFNEGAYGILQEPLSESAAIQLVRQAIKKSRWTLDEAGLREEMRRSNEKLRKTVEAKDTQIARLADLNKKISRLCHFLLSNRDFKTRSVKMLFVSDSAYQRGLVEERFARLGFMTRGADSAEAAMPVILDYKPDIVVSDLELAGMSGVDLAREVKGKAGYPPVYFVILTASADKSDAVLAPGTMVDGMAVKPASVDEYGEMIVNVSLGILTL